MNLLPSDIEIQDLDIEVIDCEACTPKNEGRIIASNQKFLAIISKTGKEILVIEPNNSISIKPDLPKIFHDSNICDLEFSPFNNNILASGHEDNSVLLWKIPEEGLKESITKENIFLKKNIDKVNFIDFNPISSEVITTCSSKGDICVWNLEKKDTFAELNLGTYTSSVSWNPDGFLIGATTYRKQFHIFDPRNNNSTIFKKQISEYFKSKFTWVDNNMFLTINWNKEGKYKLLKLWDIKKFDNEISSIKIDSSQDLSTPFINRELKLVYIIEKDNIYVYDYNNTKLYDLTQFEFKKSSNYTILFDRRSLDKTRKEIDRFATYSIY